MQEPMKGTVTPLASLFPPEEAQKASKRVLDAIADRQLELDRLQGFIADNNALVNLVQRLPDELHHDIMVPFGKAAFFPGRLVHTNEFLVLLGEGYYAERTSKQTVEILNRRGKALESKVDSLKAMMMDLKAEASFFDATAAEAVEGLVEIREDYVEEDSSKSVIETGHLKPDSSRFSGADQKKVVKDEEYTQMMLRLDELEKAELAAESEDQHDENEHNEADAHHLIQNSGDHFLGGSEESQIQKTLHHSNDAHATTEGLPSKKHFEEEEFANSFKSKVQLEGMEVQSVSEGDVSHGKRFAHGVICSTSHGEDNSTSHGEDNSTSHWKDNIQAPPTTKAETSVQSSKPVTDSLKAFTGSIVEHAHNLQMNPKEQTLSSTQSPGSQPAKPVSRFKMQRR